MAELVENADEVVRNILRFDDEVRGNDEFQRRLGYVRAWYAAQDTGGEWKFAASKFVGYQGLDAKTYLDSKEEDGRLTEPRLQEWFAAVHADSELGVELKDSLKRYLAQYGKEPSTRTRINVLSKGPDAVKAQKDGPIQVLTDTLIAAAKTLPPACLARLRAEVFGKPGN